MKPAVAKAELLAPGTTIGRYYLLQRLAVGGMAELYLAAAEGIAGFQRIVVVKHVLPHLALNPDFVSLFLNEARLAACLAHPNIVQVTDIGETEGDFFYVMEYVHGRNARELLREGAGRDGIPLDVALSIVIAAAAALAHTHAAADLTGRPLGLIHRDVSPANLLVSYEGGVKLTDFGIAKASEKTNETVGGAVKGKVGYMSPEQCRGAKIDQRSDLFALGVVLFELTTCERLFFGHNDFAILNSVMAGEIDKPSDRVPGYPAALEPIVLRALAVDPAERYQTADALREDLEAFAHECRLRTSDATVAAWMTKVFGTPELPKVELSVATGTSEPIPTLIAVVATEQDHIVPLLNAHPPELKPSKMPWVVAAAASLALAGVLASRTQDGPNATPSTPAPREPLSAVDDRVPAVGPSRPIATDDPEGEPADVPQPVHEAVAVEVEPERVEDPPASKKKSTRRRKKSKKPNKQAPDINALFPVGGGQ